jgi:hypothetical protein
MVRAAHGTGRGVDAPLGGANDEAGRRAQRSFAD